MTIVCNVHFTYREKNSLRPRPAQQLCPYCNAVLWPKPKIEAVQSYLDGLFLAELCFLSAAASRRRLYSRCCCAVRKRCSQEMGNFSFRPWREITAYSGRLSMTILCFFPFSVIDEAAMYKTCALCSIRKAIRTCSLARSCTQIRGNRTVSDRATKRTRFRRSYGFGKQAAFPAHFSSASLRRLGRKVRQKANVIERSSRRPCSVLVLLCRFLVQPLLDAEVSETAQVSRWQFEFARQLPRKIMSPQ